MTRRTNIFVFWLSLAAASNLPIGLLHAADIGDVEKARIAERLKAVYPTAIAGIERNDVVFRDGARLPLSDGRNRSFDAWLSAPDIADMFRLPYPAGAPIAAPAKHFDPGRARNADFFRHIYGDCRSQEFATSLTTITWLPHKFAQKIEVTTRGGVDTKFKAVSDELDRLPSTFDPYLRSAGAFNCRVIAGTDRASAHGYGIAIDIGVRFSNYWLTDARGHKDPPPFKNAMPPEIVSIFEKHGFIWGGRWAHFDTMHFEYRPELLPPSP